MLNKHSEPKPFVDLAKGFLLPKKKAVQWCRHFVRRRLSCRVAVVLLEIGYCFNPVINKLNFSYGKPQKRLTRNLLQINLFLFFKVAGWMRHELATSCVTACYDVLWCPRDFY